MHYTAKKVPATMLISFVAGNVSGLLGVGGGIFKVPAMHIISGIPMKAATATSNFMIGVTAAASAFIYFAHGHLNPFVASTAALGVLAGSMTGIRISRKIQSNVLTWIFAITLSWDFLSTYFKMNSCRTSFLYQTIHSTLSNAGQAGFSGLGFG